MLIFTSKPLNTPTPSVPIHTHPFQMPLFADEYSCGFQAPLFPPPTLPSHHTPLPPPHPSSGGNSCPHQFPLSFQLIDVFLRLVKHNIVLRQLRDTSVPVHAAASSSDSLRATTSTSTSTSYVGVVHQFCAAQWLRRRTLGQENPSSHPVLPCRILSKFVHCTLLYVIEYLAIDSGGYFYIFVH